jgi:DTW domain-containing protein YfiP
VTARCARCLFAAPACVCAHIPVVATRTRIVIVRHKLERHRSSNSGRLAHLALANSELVEYGDGVAPLLPREGAWLVFPEGAAEVAEPPPRALIVLDATWSQARRMYRKLDALRGLPLLRLPERAVGAARMRESPGGGRVSTIEAIAEALRVVEGGEAPQVLERVFAAAVRAAGKLGRRSANSP